MLRGTIMQQLLSSVKIFFFDHSKCQSVMGKRKNLPSAELFFSAWKRRMLLNYAYRYTFNRNTWYSAIFYVQWHTLESGCSCNMFLVFHREEIQKKKCHTFLSSFSKTTPAVSLWLWKKKKKIGITVSRWSLPHLGISENSPTPNTLLSKPS